MDRITWQGIACLVGGFVMHLTLGGIYTFGNLTSYLTSYLHDRVSSEVSYSSTMWVAALMNVGQGLALPLGGCMYERFGPRITCVTGCTILTLSVAVSRFAVNSGLPLLALTFGLVGGLGVGVAYVAPMSCAMKWFPDRRGLANGIIVAGFGLGSLIFNWIQTGYLNPDNLSVGQDNYFHQSAVLDRVPSMFLVLAMVYALFQTPSILAIRDPPSHRSRSTSRGSLAPLTSSSDYHHESPIDDIYHSVLQEPEGMFVSPRQALKTLHFFQLTLVFFFNTLTIGFINPLWKAYGQTFIQDDHFLAFVGSMAAVFNCLGRVIWGTLYDRTSFKTSMLLSSCMLCAGFGSLQLTPFGGRWMFAVWIWIIYMAFSANFCLIISAVSATFGLRHAAAIYGLVFSSTILSSPISVGMTSVLLHSVGFSRSFYIQSVIVLASILVTLSFRERKPQSDEMELREG